MLLTKEAKTKWNNANKKQYITKGYNFTKIGDEFLVKVEDLSKGSHAEVEVLCDYCLKEIIKTKFNDYNTKSNKSIIKKDSCKNCKGKKLKNQI